MRYRRPNFPFPRSDCTEAAFALNFSCRAFIVSYVGSPTIGSTDGKGKVSLIFSVRDAILKGGGSGVKS